MTGLTCRKGTPHEGEISWPHLAPLHTSAETRCVPTSEIARDHLLLNNDSRHILGYYNSHISVDEVQIGSISLYRTP